MTQNVLTVGAEVITIVLGAVVLLALAVALAWGQRSKVLPGSTGRRTEGEEGAAEEIRPEEYVESFNQHIQSAAGSMPWTVVVATVVILVWWVIYLIMNWTPR